MDSTSNDTPEETLPETSPETPKGADPKASWDSLGLSEDALKLIRNAGFDTPTPVQTGAIPLALEGFDVIASAQTGTGKTASFVLPMVEKLAGRQGTFGLILSPTREIAQQTQATLELFGKPRGVRSVVLIGGIDMRIDNEALQNYPQVIVATPGRLCDHLDRGTVWLEYIEMVVLDEADRMLDMGFSAQLSRIMLDVPKNRQTLLFSATIPPSVDALAQKILHEPKRVAIGKPLSASASVEQHFVYVDEESKNRKLRELLQREKGSVIVFTRSKDSASRVWRSLHSAGVYDATYIHSDRIQAHRELALEEFKSGKYRILIATDIAGRGIHVDDVAHVINYDLPYEPEDYVHRIGRTGRADAKGHATSFVTHKNFPMLKTIERLLKTKIEVEGAPGSTPAPVRSGNPSPVQPRVGRPLPQTAQDRSAHSGSGRASSGDADAPQKKRRRRRSGRGGSGGGGKTGGAPGGPSGGSGPGPSKPGA
jgi:ATP-dependent RNA helicase RhlE